MPAPTQTPPPLYLDTVDATDQFLQSIAGVRDLAIDTEGASFHRFIDRIYLLQLSTPEQSAIIDPLPIGVPARLGAMIEDPAVEVIFHDADYDLRLLHQDYGWTARRIFDTRVAAQLLGYKAFGLAALLERHFGVQLDKKHQRADWSMRPLTAGMLDYAAQDTRYLIDLRDSLKVELEEKGRWEWAREEFARLEGTQWDDSPYRDEEAFLRLKRARDLSRRELALLRELVRWRDGIARELDRATFRVVGNEVLLEWARKAPRTLDEAAAVRGAPRALLDRKGQELLNAIAAGNAVPEDALPRFPRSARWDRDPEFEPRVNRLKAVRDAAADRLGMDPGVLCSRDRLESIARRKPSTLDELAELPELRRWQIAEMGEELLRAVAGG